MQTPRYSRVGRACLSMIVAALASPAMASAQVAATPRVQPPFVGKIWRSTDPSAAPGSLRVFLPDGTLVMVSCTARIEADIVKVTAPESP